VNIIQYVSIESVPLSAQTILLGFDVVPAMVALRVASDLTEHFTLSTQTARTILNHELRLGPHAFRPAKTLTASTATATPREAELRRHAVEKATEKQAERIFKYVKRGFEVV
jgi:hypothetical protein